MFLQEAALMDTSDGKHVQEIRNAKSGSLVKSILINIQDSL